MPLPPLPANNTARLFVTYNDSINEHVAIVRYTSATNALSVANAFGSLLTDIEPSLADGWSVTNVEYQAANSIVRLPVGTNGAQGFVSASGFFLDGAQAPRQTKFVGRSGTSGRQVTFGLFGLIYTTPASYRFTGVLPTWASRILLFLRDFPTEYAVAIDGSAPDWRDYANVNYNSYWETDARS